MGKKRLRTEHRSEPARGGGAEERRETADDGNDSSKQEKRKIRQEQKNKGEGERKEGELAGRLPIPAPAQRVVSKRNAAA